MQGTRVRSLGQEDPLEKEMAIHSSMLAWTITRTEEPGRLQSMRSQTEWLNNNNRQDPVFSVNVSQRTSVSPWIHNNVSHLIAPNKVLSRWGGGLVAKSCSTLCDPMDPASLLCPWDFPGKNTEVGCYFLLQGVFLTQGLNPRLLLASHLIPTLLKMTL